MWKITHYKLKTYTEFPRSSRRIKSIRSNEEFKVELFRLLPIQVRGLMIPNKKGDNELIKGQLHQF